MSARTFDELHEGTSPGDSLAYWLGPYGGSVEADALLDVGRVMNLQYDHEEQADCFGSALPEDTEWTKVFFPVAPVQLALRWSPLTCAVAVMGEPTGEALEKAVMWSRLSVAAWDWAAVARIKSTARSAEHADEKRFLGLLTVSVTRARERRRGLLLAAKPGWSYGHVHEVPRQTAKLMSRAGFAVTTRRP